MKGSIIYLSSFIAVLTLSSCQDGLLTDKTLQVEPQTVITASTDEGKVKTSLSFNDEFYFAGRSRFL